METIETTVLIPLFKTAAVSSIWPPPPHCNVSTVRLSDRSAGGGRRWVIHPRSATDDWVGGRRSESGFTCRPHSLSPLITTVFSLAGDSPTCAADFLFIRVVEMENKYDFFPQNDIRDYSSLYKLCEGVDCIFHTASYGMSGPEQVTWTKSPHWL